MAMQYFNFSYLADGQRSYDSRIVGGHPAQLNAVKHQVKVALENPITSLLWPAY